MKLEEVHVAALAPDRLLPLIGTERAERFEVTGKAARELLAGRIVLNVNSTATGGGVAEMLQTLLAYARGAGVDARWVVIEGDPHFFEITKRIHNHLLRHRPATAARSAAPNVALYEETLRGNADELLATSSGPRHRRAARSADRQGWRRPLARAGVTSCGAAMSASTRERRTRIGPGISCARTSTTSTRYVFSAASLRARRGSTARAHVVVIPPSIDPFSAKNEPMSPADVAAVLRYVGLLAGERADSASSPVEDGSRGRITRHGRPARDRAAAAAGRAARVQASRWDRAEGHGRRHGGLRRARRRPHGPPISCLPGPSSTGVADDPEGAARARASASRSWRGSRTPARRRVHLACLPMDDADENALIVNALQRHAAVVVQKSLAEGFGLTVAEAMWKGRPVVASAVGGIVDQIVSGEHGLLVDDPRDPAAFGQAVRRLLDDPPCAELLGEPRGSGARRSTSVTATSSSTRDCSRNLDHHAEAWSAPSGQLQHAGGAVRCGRWDGRADAAELLLGRVGADTAEEDTHLGLPALEVSTRMGGFPSSGSSVAGTPPYAVRTRSSPSPTSRMFRTHCVTPRGATR